MLISLLDVAFAAALGTAVNATYEAARFDPLWDLMSVRFTAPFHGHRLRLTICTTQEVTLVRLTSPNAFATFLATMQSYVVSYDAASASAGMTGNVEQPVIDAYPALTTGSMASLAFLDAYKTAMAEDIAATMLWAAREGVTDVVSYLGTSSPVMDD